MSWTNELQNWVVFLALAGFMYAAAGPVFRSASPTGQLSWSARRCRLGLTLALLIFSGGTDVHFALERHHISSRVGYPLWIALSFLLLLLIRWWWRDWEKEKRTREALTEKLHQEGREFVIPQMSRSKRIWNWILIVYGAAGLAGGLYEIILHSLSK